MVQMLSQALRDQILCLAWDSETTSEMSSEINSKSDSETTMSTQKDCKWPIWRQAFQLLIQARIANQFTNNPDFESLTTFAVYSLAQSLFENTNAPFRDQEWQSQTENAQKQLITIFLELRDTAFKLHSAGQLFALSEENFIDLFMELLVDSLVLCEWMIEVDFKSLDCTERLLTIGESVLFAPVASPSQYT